MGRKPFMGTALAVLGLAAISGSAIAATGARTKVKCTMHLQSLAAPSDTTGEAFGTSVCSHAFGRGVMQTSYTATPTSATTASVTGPFKQYYDTGTVHGTFKFTLSVAPSGAVSYAGKATVLGGTGAYKHVSGSGPLTGSASDAHHSTFSYKVTVTHHT